MEVINQKIGKFLYGFVFVVLVPAILIFWSISTESKVLLKVPNFFNIEYLLMVVGFILMLVAFANLKFKGDGLPMNLYPPKKYVHDGIYKYIAHPAYTGAIMLSFGLSVFFQSKSGFWLASPILFLSVISLLWGYENRSIDELFGKDRIKPLLKIPINSEEKATIWDKISIYLVVLLPWGILYESAIWIGKSPIHLSSYFEWENTIPVIEFTHIFYILVYPLVLSIPLVLNKKFELRKFAIITWISTIIGIFVYYVIPFYAPHKQFIPESFLGEMILWERGLDSELSSFPSFHVIFAYIVANFYITFKKQSKLLWYLLATLISISCITTGVHSIADVIFGVVIAFFSINYELYLTKTLLFTEKIANSWKEWHFGKIRIINHGFYAGLGVFVGITIISLVLGKDFFFQILIIGLSNLIGAGLWAQLIEGSPKLLRPFGYYGGVLGTIFGALISSIIFDNSFILLIGAYALAAPWIQLFGRFRCLVQGCCHGSIAGEKVGIRFFNPKSRVIRISNLKGEYLHPTQLYSIIGNIFIGLLLFRLYIGGVGFEMLAGLYLILAGIARFVEESFRGESQTEIKYGLRIYQWLSILSVLIGIFITSLPTVNHTGISNFSLELMINPIFLALITTFAMGIDFPNSNKRFSRLV